MHIEKKKKKIKKINLVFVYVLDLNKLHKFAFLYELIGISNKFSEQKRVVSYYFD